MHPQATEFIIFVKSILRDYFINKNVLDVGSGDINGNNRFLFENCSYEGNDVTEANNVTIVSKTKDLSFDNNHFDTIISTECFEHDPEYKESLLKIYEMLKPNGLFLFTCASTGREEHGTINYLPNSSYGTIANLTDMINYYKNLTEIEINEVLNLSELFSSWDTYYNCESFDLYFVGIKKSNELNEIQHTELPKYNNTHVTNTSGNIYINNLQLTDIIDNSRTDKNTTHSYLETYEKLFRSKKNSAKNILEIGVQDGGSIKLWFDYFKNATIYGIDLRKIRDMWNELKNKSRIKLGCFDAYSRDFIDKYLIPLNVKFDILIDDGPHTLKSMKFFINNYLQLLKDDGILVVEDIQHIEWVEELINIIPNEYSHYIEIYDLRNEKNRYDDILLVINKNK
jgi:2-polyprenyl-3-methyl-5-hydroxy-6-metoxy-1,4-benzoquinol methylase